MSYTSYTWSSYLNDPYALKNGAADQRKLSAKAQHYIEAVDPCRIYRLSDGETDLFALYDCGEPAPDEINLSLEELEKLLEAKAGGSALSDYYCSKDEAKAEGKTVKLFLSYSSHVLNKTAEAIDTMTDEGQKILEAMIPKALPLEKKAGHYYLNGKDLIDEALHASDGRIFVDGEKYERLSLYELDDEDDPVEMLIDFGVVRI